MESMSVRRHKTELPLSLIESNILPRLPAKSVIRCMCVCKQWRSFLSTPTFARMHLGHVTIDDYKLLELHDGSFHTLSLDASTTIRRSPNPDPSVKFILATLDGLVCLANLRENPTTYELAFWNPSTGAYKKLSPARYLGMLSRYDAFGLYIDDSNDYKLLDMGMGSVCGTYIYSLRSDSWRKIDCPVRTLTCSTWSPATFWRHCLYFTVTCHSRRVVIRFDVKTETFKEIQFPLVGDIGCGILGVLNGRIHLCVSGTLWRMNGNGNGNGNDNDNGNGWWVNVAAYDDPLYNQFERRHITRNLLDENTRHWCFRCSSIWKKRFFEPEYLFTRHWCFHCSSTWKTRSSRIMYAETFVSPDP